MHKLVSAAAMRRACLTLLQGRHRHRACQLAAGKLSGCRARGPGSTSALLRCPAVSRQIMMRKLCLGGVALQALSAPLCLPAQRDPPAATAHASVCAAAAGVPPNYDKDVLGGDSGGPLIRAGSNAGEDVQASRAGECCRRRRGRRRLAEGGTHAGAAQRRCARALAACSGTPPGTMRGCWRVCHLACWHACMLCPSRHPRPPARCLRTSAALQYGLVSGGPIYKGSFPGWYTNVTRFASWIRRGMRVSGRRDGACFMPPTPAGSIAWAGLRWRRAAWSTPALAGWSTPASNWGPTGAPAPLPALL